MNLKLVAIQKELLFLFFHVLHVCFFLNFTRIKEKWDRANKLKELPGKKKRVLMLE